MRAALLAAAGCGGAAALRQLHGPSTVAEGWAAAGGAPDPSEEVRVVASVRRGEAGVRGLAAAVRRASDPRSPHFLRHLSWDEAGELARPPPARTELVRRWLAEHGAAGVRVHPHGDSISATLSLRALEGAVGGRFANYHHAASGRSLARLTTGVWLPDEVADALDALSGFNGFPLAAPTRPSVGAGAEGAVNPALINKVHNVPTVAKSGKPNIQAIAQFQGQYVNETDLSEFCKKYEPFGNECKIKKFVGSNGNGHAGVESMLDTEYIMGLGQGAETWVFSYPNRDFCSDLLQFGSDVTENATFPYSISISYGSQKIDYCNISTEERLSEDVQKMAAMGITVMISSGDDGSGGHSRQGTNIGKLSPSYPASIPFAVAVGSTYFINGTSGEQQATTQFGSGGGFSYDWAVPDYQKDVVAAYLKKTTPPLKNLEYSTKGRGTPDVSLLGEQFNVLASGRYEAVGGTSASSPSFAAFVTLWNELCLAAGGRTLGFALPLLYANAAAFTDITKGSSAIGSNKDTGVWQCEEGWDAATGLGVPDFAKVAAVVTNACASAAPPAPPAPTLPPQPATPAPPTTPRPPPPPPAHVQRKVCTDAACSAGCGTTTFTEHKCARLNATHFVDFVVCNAAEVLGEVWAGMSCGGGPAHLVRFNTTCSASGSTLYPYETYTCLPP